MHRSLERVRLEPCDGLVIDTDHVSRFRCPEAFLSTTITPLGMLNRKIVELAVFSVFAKEMHRCTAGGTESQVSLD